MKLMISPAPGGSIITLPCKGHTGYSITLQSLPGETPSVLFERLASVLGERNAVILAQDIYGTWNRAEVSSAVERVMGPLDWPVTGIGEAQKEGVLGTHVHAVAGVPVKSLRWHDQPVGRVFEDEDAVYCFLGDLHAANPSAPPAEQARQTFPLVESILSLADLTFSHVIRTWFYLGDIHSWYPEFNKARRRFFLERHVFENLVPASTAVGAGSSPHRVLVGKAFAVRSKNSHLRAQAVSSPMQPHAITYGSAFSRAVQLTTSSCRRLYVSGTAAIGPDGCTVSPHRIEDQIQVTMSAVETLLRSAGMRWQDVVRAVVYCKDSRDAPRFQAYCDRSGLPSFPVIIAQSAICRPELLFEIEVDAVSYVIEKSEI